MESPDNHVRPDMDSMRASWPYAPPLAGEQASDLRREAEYISGTVKETTAWDVYNNEARKMDNELVKDWMASLNFLLVFAAIFSAVLAAFIIESKKLLEQDPNEVMVDIMIFYTNNLAGGVRDVYNRKEFQPSNSAISINCLLFGSLSASLVAALASVISLQWVAEYDAAITRGGSSPQDRAKRRQFRYAGVEKWKMGSIIASLPLLLYFSVVLFFAGVIQWMLLVHTTVGYVVAGGAGIAATFYLASTSVAVMFVSAPFKSPLTRWIYSAYYLFIAVAHRVITIVRIQNVPGWIESQHKKYDVTHKREDIAVETRLNLNYQAMNWLARQVSISEDSRRRLDLLVSELLRWPLDQLQSPDFQDGPWINILNFLAQKYRKSMHMSPQTRTEEQEFALLVNCAGLPGVAAIITPQVLNHDYNVNQDDALYWPQHCFTSEGAPAPVNYEWRSGTRLPPDAIFLVTRDLPIPSLRATGEMRITLKLAKWRNTDRHSLTFWQSFFNAAETFSDNFFDAAVCILSNYIVADARRQPKLVPKGTISDILQAVVERAASGGISPEALNALSRAFETIVQEDASSLRPTSKALLQLPLSYGFSLHKWDIKVRNHNLHQKIALLLAREVQRLPNAERLGRLPDLLAMLWLDFGHANRQYWEQLKTKYGEGCTLEKLKQQILHDWIFHVRGSEILESVCVLIQTSAEDPEFGVSWLCSCARSGRLGVFAVLKLFDRLLSEKQSILTPLTLVKTLCKMLKKDQFLAYGRELSEDTTAIPVVALTAPCLHLISYRALGLDQFDGTALELPMWSILMDETIEYILWNMSALDSRSIWQLRAWMLFDSTGHHYSELITRLLERAFQNSEHLHMLQRIFAERTLCNHYSGPGHLLHHLQMPLHVIFRSNIRLFGTISLSNLRLAPITALLAASCAEDVSSLGLPNQVDKACMLHLWNYIQSFSTDQSSMFAFLLDLPLLYIPAAKWGSFAVLLRAIECSISLSADNASISLLLPLSKRILELPSSYFQYLSPGDIEKWNVELTTLMENGDRINGLALSRRATMTIYGLTNHRYLSCAKSVCDILPATGWWPMY